MRVLINVDPSEKGNLYTLQYELDRLGHNGQATSKVFNADSLTKLAKQQGCDCILLCNEKTLNNLVPSISGPATLNMWRGSRLNLSVPVIVCDRLANYHATNEGPFLMRKDLGKLAMCRVPPAKFTYSVLRSTKDFDKWEEIAKRAVVIGGDIETNQHGMKKKDSTSSRVPCFNKEEGGVEIEGLGETWITCNGFSFLMPDGSIETCVLPLVNGDEDYWHSDSDYARALGFMRFVYSLPAPKCFHNGLYDCFHLIRYRAWPNNWTMDTMGLSHSLYSELDKALWFLASWCLYDAYYWKDLADATHKAKDPESYWLYNAKDCWVMMRCLAWLLKNGEAHMFTNYSRQFKQVYPSLNGAFEGFLVDNIKRKELLTTAQDRLEGLKAKLRILTDDPNFNPGSWQQKSEILYNVLGAVKNPRAKGEGATDKKSLTYAAAQHPLVSRFCDLFGKYNLDSKAISTYYSFLQWNSRLMFSLDPFGTETGRYASRGSAAWIGTQIQNQPPYAKAMYIPDPGFIGFEIDFSKAEAICTAFLSGCEKLIQALCYPELDKNGKPKDFYKVLGELFFGMPYEEVTKEFRNDVLKKIQHGTNYMMQALTFIDNLKDISVLYFAADLLGIVITPTPRGRNQKTMKQFAQMLLDSYHTPFPEVSTWWDAIENEIITTGRLVSPTGHVRVFFGDPRKDHKVKRSGVAHQPQNFSVEQLNKGFFKAYRLQQALTSKVLRIKTQIHDSVKGQVAIEHARKVIPELAALVEAKAMVHGREMTIKVEVEVYHTNWKEKVAWEDFIQTTLPMLENQKSLTSTIDGLA